MMEVFCPLGMNRPFGSMLFRDRQDAGEQLAAAVVQKLMASHVPWKHYPSVVYGLPRGGVMVAAPLAQTLNCSLDVVVAKKITLPEHPEFAIGAITAEGQVLRAQRQAMLCTDDRLWDQARQEAWQRAQEQWQQFLPVSPQINPQGAIAFLTDDGIATGLTMAVAARSIWAKRPAYLLICAPVAPPLVALRLRQWCDRVIVLHTPTDFSSVSRFYEAFPQVEMDEAIACLQHHNRHLLP